MSLTGSGPDDPQRVGVPIGDLLAGMYGAYGVLAALLERERTGRGQVVRTSLLAAIVGVHAFQGTRVDGGRRGRPARRATTTRRSPRTACSTAADGSVQIACGSEGLWRRLCAEFGFDPEAPGHGHQRRAGRQPRAGHRRCSRRPSPTSTRRTCWPGWPRPASRRARCARSTRSTAGTRPCRRGCWSTSSTPRSARSRCPGRRCASSRPVPDGEVETTRPRARRSPGPRRRRRRHPGLAGGRRRAAAGRRRRRGRARDVSPTGWMPAPCATSCSTPGRGSSWDSPVPARDVSEQYAAELAGRRGEEPAGRVDHHRRGAAARPPRRRRRRRVRLPRRLDRRGRRRAADRRRGAGHRGGPAAARRAGLGRHPDAGGHRRLPADDRHHRRDRPPQGGRAALPGLPAQPHVRRGAGVVGLARARDHRRARAPRSASSDRGSTRRSTASRSPRACRPPRTWPSTACSTPSSRTRRSPTSPTGRCGCWRPGRPGTSTSAAPSGPRPEDGTDADDPEDHRSAWDVVTRLPAGGPARASARLLRTAATDVVGLSRHRRRREGPRAAAGAGPVRRARRASSSVRTGAASRCRLPSGRPRCARPAAACTWPRSCGCRWSR